MSILAVVVQTSLVLPPAPRSPIFSIAGASVSKVFVHKHINAKRKQQERGNLRPASAVFHNI